MKDQKKGDYAGQRDSKLNTKRPKEVPSGSPAAPGNLKKIPHPEK